MLDSDKSPESSPEDNPLTSAEVGSAGTVHRWGEDPITSFIDLARDNSFATFQRFQKEFRRLVSLDAVFLALIEDWRDPPEPVAATLLIRSHSAFRAGIQLAMSGQAPEAVAIARVTLESALYALHVATEESALQAWQTRHDGPKHRRATRSSFGMKSIWQSVKRRAPDLEPTAQALYESTIDHGAHPNVHAVMGTVRVEETPEWTAVESSYIAGDELTIRYALRVMAQIGVMSLLLAGKIFESRFEQLGLADRVEDLKAGL